MLFAAIAIADAELSTSVAKAGVAVEATTEDSVSTTEQICRTDSHHWNDHPALCMILQRLYENEEKVIHELGEFAKISGWLVDVRTTTDSTTSPPQVINNKPILRKVDNDLKKTMKSSIVRQSRNLFSKQTRTNAKSAQFPVVLAHGMGDSCFNDGMIHVTKLVSEWLGNVYTVCIPTGTSQEEDTKNGYFLNMDASVDVFADGVAKDPNLRNGFHAMGFSQGNNVIRGYIAKYNSPVVHTFLSINGVNAGIGAVPYCRPRQVPDQKETSLFFPSMCDLLMEQASHAAYTEFAQQHSFQANYWRDPRPQESETYRKMSQLAVWNNEVPTGSALNETLRENWSKTSRFVWVLATDDQMVWPAVGEQWGAPDPLDPFQRVVPMKETEWYTQDLFGLKTADLDGKNQFESFEGDHLQFTKDDLERWVKNYFLL